MKITRAPDRDTTHWRAAAMAAWTLASATACGAAEESREPSFQRDVMPVLHTSCTFGSSCHGASSAAGYMQLGPADSVPPDQLLLTLVGAPSVTEPAMPRVAPGDSLNSFLVRKLRGDFSDLQCAPLDCGERMPYRAPALPPETLELIARWIDLGASM